MTVDYCVIRSFVNKYTQPIYQQIERSNDTEISKQILMNSRQSVPEFFFFFRFRLAALSV